MLFWSDTRVPHAVLPSYADRFAVTVWFFDTKERAVAEVEAKDASVRAADHEKVAKEIKDFEAQYGEATVKPRAFDDDDSDDV